MAGGPDVGAQAPYKICVVVGPDGSMKVGIEPPEDPAEAPEDGMMKPVPSAKAAMMMVMDIIKNGGKMPDGQEDDAFDSGFGKKNPPPLIDKMKMDGDDQ